MNPLSNLVNNLKEQLSVDNLLFRISAGSDLERVKQYGSSRVGLSSKCWDALDKVSLEHLPYYPILHEDVIIASTFDDLWEDSLLENGTLKHKFTIYSSPFFTVYKKEQLTELYKEPLIDKSNQGRHFLMPTDKLNALHSLWLIHENTQLQYHIERIQ